MSWNLSEDFQESLLNVASYKTTIAAGFIKIYTSPMPTTADDAATGTLLATITDGGLTVTPGTATNGLNVELTGQTLGIASGEDWFGTAVATGTAYWGRWFANAAGTAVLKDGLVSTTAGGDIVMEGGRNVVSGAPVSITSVAITASGV